MPGNGLAFAAHHLRHRAESSGWAARSHPFISGILASVNRRFRPRSAAVEPRREVITFRAATGWAVPMSGRVEDRVAVEIDAKLRGAQVDAKRVSIHPDISIKDGSRWFHAAPTGLAAEHCYRIVKCGVVRAKDKSQSTHCSCFSQKRWWRRRRPDTCIGSARSQATPRSAVRIGSSCK